MPFRRASHTVADVYPRLTDPASPGRRGSDGTDASRATWGAARGTVGMRPGPARLWFGVALCLLAASAAPPAAGAAQAPSSLTLAADRHAVGVGARLHLTATLSGPVQDAFVKVHLPSGLTLLSASPPSASLGTWSVPHLEAGQTDRLTLLVRVVRAGKHTASVELPGVTTASTTIAARHRCRRR